MHKEWLVCAQKQVFSLVPCDDEGKEPEVSLAEFLLLLVHIWYRFVLLAARATAPVTAQGKSAINFDTYSTQRPEKNLRGGREGGGGRRWWPTKFFISLYVSCVESSVE